LVLGAVLILLTMVPFVLVYGNPFIVFSHGLWPFGVPSIILGLVVIGSGFIDKKTIRLSVAIASIFMWAVINFRYYFLATI